MPYETIVGRTKEDLEKYGNKASGYIGKHIVGTGEDTHLTTKVFLDLLKPHVILVAGKRGSGKCLEENTLITLDDGRLVPIKELEKLEQKIFALNDKLKIVPATKSNFYKREVNRLFYLKLRSGREIKLTPEHPLLTLKGWTPVNELKVGSRITTPRKITVLGNKIMPEHEIKLLAYFIAEGHLPNNFVLFSNTDPEIINDFLDSIWKFNENLIVSVHSKPYCYRVTISSRFTQRHGNVNPLKVWFEGLKLYNKLSKDKIIPDCIFQLPDHLLALFLNRLFSCDGCIYRREKKDKFDWQISYSSRSEKLIHQLQHLLMRFEILSKIRQKMTKIDDKIISSYEILIYGENVIKFINRIGFFGKQKEKQEKALKECANLLRNPNVDTIPKELWEIYRPTNWAIIGRLMGYSTPKALRSSINYSPSRSKLLQITQIENNEQLYLLATSDIFWDEIVNIEELKGKFTVYDIEVPEFHNFVANDIIVHNSYSASVILEEFCALEENFRKKIAFVVVDPMGIYWSMKFPNEQQRELLKKWDLEPKKFDNIKVYVPAGQREEYERAGIPVDSTIAIPLTDFSPEDLILAFGLKRTEEMSISLEKNFNSVLQKNKTFGFEELIEEIQDDKETKKEVKDALTSLLKVVSQWGLIVKEGVRIEDFVKAGEISIMDLSRLKSNELRILIAALISRRVLRARVIARKEEETAKIEEREAKIKFPLTWLIFEEAHGFVPNEGVVTSSVEIQRIAKEGREPGVGLIVITQMPNKVHSDVLSQCDLVISFRLTSKNDLDALHTVYQSYMREELEKLINRLPRTPGAAIILDDNLEKIFTVNIRPRISWHAGGTAALV